VPQALGKNSANILIDAGDYFGIVNILPTLSTITCYYCNEVDARLKPYFNMRVA